LPNPFFFFFLCQKFLFRGYLWIGHRLLTHPQHHHNNTHQLPNPQQQQQQSSMTSQELVSSQEHYSFLPSFLDLSRVVVTPESITWVIQRSFICSPSSSSSSSSCKDPICWVSGK
jgi:hypothetical protein